MVTARRTLAATLALAALGTAPARADHPGLSRGFAVPDAAPALPAPTALAARSDLTVAIALAWFSRALESGTAGPRAASGEIGGVGAFRLALGRWELGGEVTEDGELNVDSREYPARIHAGAAWPEAGLTARVVAGFDQDRYGGTDLELESAPLPLRLPGVAPAARPRLVAWLRGRKFDFAEALLDPALGLVVGPPFPGLRGLSVALSAQSDLARGDRPSSLGMVTLRWSPAATREDEPAGRPLGALRGGSLDRRWFAFGAWAFPLDRGQYSRLAVGAGVRLATPVGGP